MTSRARLGSTTWSAGRIRPALVAPALTVAVVMLAVAAVAQQPATPVDDRVAHEVASQLRCVVCQNLSVADSPSEMAAQMRGIVRERLAAGDRPDQVIQYFVDRYGEWILLAPRPHGFTLLVWLVPMVALVVGLVVAILVIRHWARRPRVAPAPATVVDADMSARIRREMESES